MINNQCFLSLWFKMVKIWRVKGEHANVGRVCALSETSRTLVNFCEMSFGDTFKDAINHL